MQTRRQKNVSVNTLTSTLFLIPVDLLMEIFSRLPLKSLATCRCVSKLWSSILTGPDFTELFLTISSTRPQILVSCEVSDDLAFFSLPQSHTSPVSLSQLTHLENHFDLNSLVYVQGLVCVPPKRFVNERNQGVAMICNPSTGQALALPKVKSRRAKIRYLFGYDPIGKVFKVLSMTTRTRNAGRSLKVCEEHQVLTLGNGKMSWRMIECCVPHSYYPHEEICIDGVLYFKSMDRSIDIYQIVCFDVRTEKFTVVTVEESLHMAVYNGTLVNYNGKFGLLKADGWSLVTRDSSSFKLWVLEDVEKQEWSVHMYEFPASWKNLVGSCWVYFVGVTQTNEVVLWSHQTSTDPLYYFYFNLETKDIARVEIQGVDESKCRVHRMFINHIENVKLV